MAASGEQVLGILSAARLGFTDFDLIVTDRRIVGVKLGSSGWAEVAGGLVGVALSLGNQNARRAEYAGMDVDQILVSDQKNFEIPRHAIEWVEFNAGISRVTMPTLTLWTSAGRKRFSFTHSIWKKDAGQVRYAKALLSAVFPGKIEFKRT